MKQALNHGASLKEKGLWAEKRVPGSPKRSRQVWEKCLRATHLLCHPKVTGFDDGATGLSKSTHLPSTQLPVELRSLWVPCACHARPQSELFVPGTQLRSFRSPRAVTETKVKVFKRATDSDGSEIGTE